LHYASDRRPFIDAAEEGAEWTEVVRVLFALDPKQNAERARRVHDTGGIDGKRLGGTRMDIGSEVRSRKARR
jgi:hypothetical protein